MCSYRVSPSTTVSYKEVAVSGLSALPHCDTPSASFNRCNAKGNNQELAWSPHASKRCAGPGKCDNVAGRRDCCSLLAVDATEKGIKFHAREKVKPLLAQALMYYRISFATVWRLKT